VDNLEAELLDLLPRVVGVACEVRLDTDVATIKDVRTEVTVRGGLQVLWLLEGELTNCGVC